MTQIDDLKKALGYLIKLDSDKTNELKEQVIEKVDNEDLQYLIEQKDKWNTKQVKGALKICAKYRKQLPKDLRGKTDRITAESIEEEEQQIAAFKESTD